MRRHQLVPCVALALFASLAEAQHFEEVSTFANLGFADEAGPREVVVLDEDTVAIVTQTLMQTPQPGLHSPLLIVCRNVVDQPTLHYVGISYPPGANELPRRPARLSADRLAIASPGPDLVHGTFDDEILLYEGLRKPQVPVETIIPANGPGPQESAKLMVLDADCVAWLVPGADGDWDSGDEQIRYATGFASGMPFVATHQASGPLRLSDFGCELVEGAWALKGPGPDGNLVTSDDQLSCLTWDVAASGLNLQASSVGTAIGDKRAVDAWPQHVGDRRVAFPDPGPDGELGSADDALVVWDFDGGPSFSQMPVGGFGLFAGGASHGRIGAESDGRIVIQGGGADFQPGTPDDELIWIDVDARSYETLVPGVGLYDFPNRSFADLTVLETDVVIGAQFGAPGIGASEFFTKRQVNGVHVVSYGGSGDPLVAVVSTQPDDVLLFYASGSVFHYRDLSQPNPSFLPAEWPTLGVETVPVVLAPNLLVSTREGTSYGGGLADDRLQIRRSSGVLRYGKATANAAGYTMGLDAPNAEPAVGGLPFWLQLLDAPPACTGYLLGSTERDSFHPAVDAEILIGLESAFAPRLLGTSANGSTYYPIFPPSELTLVGVIVHLQMLIFDPSCPRQYELSNGLTLIF